MAASTGRSSRAGQGIAVPAGGRRQRTHVAQFLATQHAAQQRALHRRAQVFLGAKFQGAGGIQQAAGLGGFLLPHGDVPRIRGWSQFGGCFATQRGAGRLCQAEPYLVEFQQADGALKPYFRWNGLVLRVVMAEL